MNHDTLKIIFDFTDINVLSKIQFTNKMFYNVADTYLKYIRKIVYNMSKASINDISDALYKIAAHTNNDIAIGWLIENYGTAYPGILKIACKNGNFNIVKIVFNSILTFKLRYVSHDIENGYIEACTNSNAQIATYLSERFPEHVRDSVYVRAINALCDNNNVNMLLYLEKRICYPTHLCNALLIIACKKNDIMLLKDTLSKYKHQIKNEFISCNRLVLNAIATYSNLETTIYLVDAFKIEVNTLENYHNPNIDAVKWYISKSSYDSIYHLREILKVNNVKLISWFVKSQNIKLNANLLDKINLDFAISCEMVEYIYTNCNDDICRQHIFTIWLCPTKNIFSYNVRSNILKWISHDEQKIKYFFSKLSTNESDYKNVCFFELALKNKCFAQKYFELNRFFIAEWCIKNCEKSDTQLSLDMFMKLDYDIEKNGVKLAQYIIRKISTYYSSDMHIACKKALYKIIDYYKTDHTYIFILTCRFELTESTKIDILSYINSQNKNVVDAAINSNLLQGNDLFLVKHVFKD